MAEPMELLFELDQLLSEQRHPNTMNLDQLDTMSLLETINDEDQKVAPAVRTQLPMVAKAVDAIVTAFSQGSRLIYIGAGTSGRLGILDAVECPPTFNVSPQMVVGLIAGGERAIIKAVEGAEDSEVLAVTDLQRISLDKKDVLVGIAASGRTPYVLSAIAYAKTLGCTTVGVCCNPGSALTKAADISICPAVGPEVLTGSTRLKSGSAQKLVLNMLTTASMVRLGKAYQNLMVDLQTTNIKLKARAVKIVMAASGCSQEAANQALQDCQGQVKAAILQVITGVDFNHCEQLLNQHQGLLGKAIAAATRSAV